MIEGDSKNLQDDTSNTKEKPPSAASGESITLAKLEMLPEPPKHHNDEDVEEVQILNNKKNPPAVLKRSTT